MGEQVRGRLLIIGGAEDKTGSCLILRRFLELAGGEQTAVAILTTATEKPREVATEYRRLFQLGAGEVMSECKPAGRSGQPPDIVFSRSQRVFFTGGDQLRLTGILGERR